MTPELSRKDKRRFFRIPQEAQVSVSRLEYPLTNKTHTVRAKDLSEDGICFLTSTPFETDTYINLEIKLQGWQNYLQNVSSIVDTTSMTRPLTAIGLVIWSKQTANDELYEVGVRFHDIYEDDYRAFHSYLNNLKDGR